MRTTIPLLLLLAACAQPTTEVSGLRDELGQLRQELQDESRRRAETVAALEDLRTAIKELGKRPPEPAPAPPIVFPPVPQGSPGLLGGVGGSAPGQNDLFWVLTRVSEGAEDRIVLALYRASPQGLKLDAVRALNQDLRILEFQNAKPSVKDVLKQLPPK